MTGQPQDRDERTGVEVRGPSWTSGEGLDPALLNELAYLVEGDGWVDLALRYGAAARILNAGWRPPAPDNGGDERTET